MTAKDGCSVRLVEITDNVSGDLDEALTDREKCGVLLTKGRRTLLRPFIRIRDPETLTLEQERAVTESSRRR